MTHITPYPLWLGHAGDGRDLRALHEAGIRALVHLAAEDPPDQPTRDLMYFCVPLVDGMGNDFDLLQLAVEIVTLLLRQNVQTLVYCGGGMSRSPAVAAVAIAFLTSRQMDECLTKLTRHSPVDVSPGLWSDMRELFEVQLG